MPTGYTAKLYDGEAVTLAEFALHCARGFGALVTMRDAPWDAPIPDVIEPYTKYHDERIAQARVQLAEARGWSDDEAATRAEADYALKLGRWEESRDDGLALRGRYEQMLREVEAWQPPTDAHEPLKDFMVDQLRSSIDFDTRTPAWSVPEPKSADDFRREQITSALRDIAYHAEKLREEISRADERTRWLRALRASLEGASA